MSIQAEPTRPPLTVVMRMHRADEGQCWADSEQMPGYTAAGEDFRAVMDLVTEGIGNGMAFGALNPALVDLRWQWCNTDRRVVAIRGNPKPWLHDADQPREACPCNREAP